MPIAVAYALVVIIWSTTPLAINWSIDGIPPIAAVTLRMAIATALGYAWVRWRRLPMQWSTPAVKSYFTASLGIYLAMFLVYLAATRVVSGLISVIFGLAPMISALLAQRLGMEARFSWIRWLAITLSLSGLCLVFVNALAVDSRSAVGLLMLLFSVTIFSVSNVGVKYTNAGLHPMVQTVGSLAFSLVFYFLTWFAWPGASLDISGISTRAIMAIIYLGIGGSLVGFGCYFLVLSRLPASTVALVTLVTPVFALMLGAWLNDELISLRTMGGAVIIGIGLIIYHWGDRWRQRPSDG